MTSKRRTRLARVDLRRSFDLIDAPVYVKDGDGKFIYVNSACAATLGIDDPSDALGKTDYQFFSEHLARTWREEEIEVVQSGAMLRREDEVPAGSAHRPGGTTIETFKLPLRNRDGEIEGVFGLSVEVEEPRLLLERYRLAVDSARDGVWYRNIETDETWFSPRWKQMLGYEDPEFPNTASALWEHIHEEDVERVQGEVRDHLARETEEYECQFRIRHKDGSFRTVRARGMAWRDEDGTAIAFAGSHTDITFYQQVIDTIPSFVFVKNRERKFQYVNDAVAKPFGLPKHDLIGRTDLDLYKQTKRVKPEQVEQFKEDDDLILAGKRKEIQRDESIGEGKELQMLDTKKVPLLDPAGNIVGLVGVSTDITNLYAERQLLNDLMDHAQDGVFFKDRDHRFTRVNRKLASLVGKTPKEMIEKTDHDFFGAKEYADLAREEEETLFQTGTPLLKQEKLTPTVDGIQWRQVTKVPIKDKADRVVGLVGISRDITEAKRDRDESESQKQLLETILNALPQCIFIKTRAGEYETCNRSFADRKNLNDPADVKGKTDYDFWPDDEEQANGYRRDDEEIIRTGKARKHYRETQVLPDGSEAILETSKIPLCNRAGEVERLLGIYEDITERLKEEKRKTQREHEHTITRTIGHCLKGWIAVLEHNCYALELENGMSDNLRRLENGITFLKHATQMATGLFTLDAPKETELLRLNALIESILGALNDERLDFHPSVDNPVVRGHKFHLQNALLELIANAHDFAPSIGDGGWIRIWVEVDQEMALIHVQDNGSGVAPRLKGRIFELFTTCSDHRTGMGLGYVHRVVEVQKGSVDEIGEPGSGAHLLVKLPMEQSR